MTETKIEFLNELDKLHTYYIAINFMKFSSKKYATQ